MEYLWHLANIAQHQLTFMYVMSDVASCHDGLNYLVSYTGCCGNNYTSTLPLSCFMTVDSEIHFYAQQMEKNILFTSSALIGFVCLKKLIQ